MPKYLALTFIFLLSTFYFLLSTTPASAQVLYDDQFGSVSGSIIPNWSNNGSAHSEDFLCGVSSGPKCVNLACRAANPGSYTNLCGSGTAATSYSCPANCSTTSSFCDNSGTSSTDSVARWQCDGRLTNCEQVNGTETWSTRQDIGSPACGKTVQIDVFTKNCRVNPSTGLFEANSWYCNSLSAGSAGADLRGYMTYYSGDCTNPVCTVGNGTITRSFSLSPGNYTATISTKAGVSSGSGSNGVVTMTATDGATTLSTGCNSSSCATGSSSFSTVLSINFPVNSVNTTLLTVTLSGAGGGCIGSTCRNPLVDDFVITKPSSTFDFSLTNNGDVYISQGDSKTNTINATLQSGTTQAVSSFTTTGLPSGATASFSPTSCSPNCTTTMTITTSTSTTTGNYPITVSSTGGGITHTTSFNLNVTSGAPPPSIGSCQIYPEGSGTTTPMDFLINTYPSVGSTPPFPVFTINGTSQTLGNWTCASIDSRWTCSARTAGKYYGGGTVLDTAFHDNTTNDCSRTITVGAPPPPSCDVTTDTYNLHVYTFEDDLFNSAQWPQMCWWNTYTSTYQLVCGSKVLYSQNINQPINLAQNNTNPSLFDQILSWLPKIFLPSLQSKSPPQNTDLAQKLPPTLPPKLMSINTHSQPEKAVLPAISCRVNTDCPNDNNVCTNDICVGYEPAGPYGPERLGTCYQPANAGANCGLSPNGGNMYCGTTTINGFAVPSGVCQDNICASDSECNDGNSCTLDKCVGNDPTTGALGTCQNSNQSPSFVCQTDGSGNPLKLCSKTAPYDGATATISTCSVDYIACSNPADNNSNCCGLTNLQQQQVCRADSYVGYTCTPTGMCSKAPFPVSWNKDSAHAFNNPLTDPVTPLPGVTVHVASTDCPIYTYSGVTDVTGYAHFYGIARRIGSGINTQNVHYNVYADVPSGKHLNRGTRMTQVSSWENRPIDYVLGPLDNPLFSNVQGGAPGWNLLTNFGFAANPTYKVTGKIYQDGGDNCLTSTTGVQGARVTLGPSSIPYDTDVSGSYIFSGLSAGTYSTTLSNFSGTIVASRIDNGTWTASSSATVSSLTLPNSKIVNYCVSNIAPWLKTTRGDVHSNVKISAPGGP